MFLSAPLPICVVWILLSLLFMFAIFMYTRFRFRCEGNAIFDVVMNASDYGQLIFDVNGKLLKINKLALSWLSNIVDGNVSRIT